MVKPKKRVFFRNPFQITQQFGEITTEIELKDVQGLKSTCVAMMDIAKTEKKDDIERKKGNDDYSVSLEKLINAFDTFIKEHTKNKVHTGDKKNYKMADASEFTLYLLWQIRHIWTHQGGVVDSKCKAKFENIFLHGKELGVTPTIDLPETLDEGLKFSIQFSDYKIIKKGVFLYIKRRISNDSYNLLAQYASTTDFKVSNLLVTIDIGPGTIILDPNHAKEYGFAFDFKNNRFSIPKGTVYEPKNRMVVLKNGKSFPATFMPRKNNRLRKVFKR